MTKSEAGSRFSSELPPAIQKRADTLLTVLSGDGEPSPVFLQEVRTQRTAIAGTMGELADLGFLPGILDAETKPDRFSFDLDDEQEGEAGERRSALWLKGPDDPGDGYGYSGAVVLMQDGSILKGWVDRDENGEVDSFHFDSSEEVPPQDYPTYVEDAKTVMKEVVEDKTGITRQRWEAEQAANLEEIKVFINHENKKYADSTAFEKGASPENARKAREHLNQIQRMRELASLPDSQLNPTQLENLLGHMFIAGEFADYAIPGELSRYGARDMDQVVGSFVAPLNDEIGSELHSLGEQMRNSYLGSLYMLRRHFQVTLHTAPENERIYNALGVYALEKRRTQQTIIPVQEYAQLPEEFRTDIEGGETLTQDEIRDWLINTPSTGGQ